VVIDNGGRLYCTVWGDIMTVMLKSEVSRERLLMAFVAIFHGYWRLSIRFLRGGRLMVTGKDRVEVDGVNVPVSVSDVQLSRKTVVVCDDTGCVWLFPWRSARNLGCCLAKLMRQKQKDI